MIRPPPHSLLARNVLLLIRLVVVSQILAIAIFIVFIQRPKIDDAATVVASQIMLVNRLLPSIPEAERRRELVMQRDVPPTTVVPVLHPFSLGSYAAKRFYDKLTSQLPPDILIRWEVKGKRRVWVRFHVGDEYYWMVSPVASNVNYEIPWTVICLLLTCTITPAVGAYAIHRRIADPLQRLSDAAATIERGAWPEPVRIDGPSEIARVADAFNRMMVALSDFEAMRAEMLAGISHDIRTPLTKLRMAIAAPEAFDAPLASAERFVEEIDLIVQQFIDFARGYDNEAPVLGDLAGLVTQLAGDYEGLGHPFELTLAPLPQLAFRPVGMQRLLMNLMHNAVAHGRTGLAVRAGVDGDWIELRVEDRGPGVPDTLLPLIKQPFRRGDAPGQKSGTGLGLAIADRIARQHGGTLDLRNVPDGGLAAVLRLPLALTRSRALT